MFTRSCCFFGILVLSGTPLPAAAQAAQGGTNPPQISPLRLEFTRPGGTPGSARYIASSKESFMLAPAQPIETTTPKKKKTRR